MPTRFPRFLLIAGLAFAAIPRAGAQDRTFADLLAKAEVQAAAGRRWAPPGDNVTETVADMMGLIASATPEQLIKLATILEDPKGTPDPLPLGESRPPIVAAPAPEDSAPPVARAPMPEMRIEPVARSPAPLATDTAVSNPTQTPPRPFVGIVVTPGPRAKDLLGRGQAAERQGDLSAARRFYASAAQQGEATAARSLGRLYDPAYLRQTAIGGIDPDPVLARRWYEEAVVLGDAEAGPLLNALAAR